VCNAIAVERGQNASYKKRIMILMIYSFIELAIAIATNSCNTKRLFFGPTNGPELSLSDWLGGTGEQTWISLRVKNLIAIDFVYKT
jgi:hypothetical protein